MIIRAQNRIAESRWAFPVTAIYSVLLCFVLGIVERQLWIQTALMAVAALMMVELNNANSLIRIYSRMVSCSFLVMTMLAAFMFDSIPVGIVQLTFIAFYQSIFRAYQDQDAVGRVFYAFFAIGVASVVFGKILFFLPVLWILLATNVLAFNVRTFFASVLGIIAPYWFVGAYYIYMGQLSRLWEHMVDIAQFDRPFDFSVLDTPRIITLVFVLVLALLGSVHFLLYSYQDKIRTRMLYEMFITLDACCFVFLFLQPQQFDNLLSMAIVTTSPLIGHFLALTHSKLSNIAFFLIVVTALAVTAYNVWSSLAIFS
ncbi:MAG: hypothetical protein KAZ98_04970 [Prevotella sp.]|nr:hypothetical protein [Prevotella sp.]